MYEVSVIEALGGAVKTAPNVLDIQPCDVVFGIHDRKSSEYVF
jgi:hypothetical protein